MFQGCSCAHVFSRFVIILKHKGLRYKVLMWEDSCLRQTRCAARRGIDSWFHQITVAFPWVPSVRKQGAQLGTVCSCDSNAISTFVFAGWRRRSAVGSITARCRRWDFEVCQIVIK